METALSMSDSSSSAQYHFDDSSFHRTILIRTSSKFKDLKGKKKKFLWISVILVVIFALIISVQAFPFREKAIQAGGQPMQELIKKDDFKKESAKKAKQKREIQKKPLSETQTLREQDLKKKEDSSALAKIHESVRPISLSKVFLAPYSSETRTESTIIKNIESSIRELENLRMDWESFHFHVEKALLQSDNTTLSSLLHIVIDQETKPNDIKNRILKVFRPVEEAYNHITSYLNALQVLYDDDLNHVKSNWCASTADMVQLQKVMHKNLVILKVLDLFQHVGYKISDEELSYRDGQVDTIKEQILALVSNHEYEMSKEGVPANLAKLSDEIFE